MLGMMSMPRKLPQLLPSSQYSYRMLPMSAYGNPPQCIHNRREHSQVMCGIHPRWCQIQPPKATSVIMCALLIRSELHPNGRYSSQVQNPMSTDNNKGGSILSPPKPTINLVSKKAVPEGDAIIRWDSKDHHYASQAYSCKL